MLCSRKWSLACLKGFHGSRCHCSNFFFRHYFPGLVTIVQSTTRFLFSLVSCEYALGSRVIPYFRSSHCLAVPKNIWAAFLLLSCGCLCDWCLGFRGNYVVSSRRLNLNRWPLVVHDWFNVLLFHSRCRKWSFFEKLPMMTCMYGQWSSADTINRDTLGHRPETARFLSFFFFLCLRPYMFG